MPLPSSIKASASPELAELARRRLRARSAGGMARDGARPTGSALDAAADRATSRGVSMQLPGSSTRTPAQHKDTPQERADRAKGDDLAKQQERVKNRGADSSIPDPNERDPDGKTEDDGEIADLARLKMRQEQERKAAEDELKAQRAKALEDVAARSGLGGMGLSGASGAMRNDTARMQDRNSTLTLADLDKRQRDEQFQQVQRDAVLNDLEAAEDIDLDGDGDVAGRKIGDGVGDGDSETEPGDDKTSGGKKKEEDKTISGHAVDAINAVADFLGVDGVETVEGVDDLPDGAFKVPRNVLEGLGLMDFEDAFYMTPDGKLYYVSDASPAAAEPMSEQEKARILADLRDNFYLDGSAE